MFSPGIGYLRVSVAQGAGIHKLWDLTSLFALQFKPKRLILHFVKNIVNTVLLTSIYLGQGWPIVFFFELFRLLERIH